MKRNRRMVKLVLLAILGAWAVVLRLFDFPLLPFAPFLKMDLSDLMVLIGMIVAGPKGLIAVAGIRDVINYLSQGGQAGIPIGVIMSFVASLAMFMPSHFILKHFKHLSTRFTFSLMSVATILSLTLAMALLNYYVALPIYATVMNFPISNYLEYVMTIIIPFNAIKGVIIALSQVTVFKVVIPMVEKKGIIHSDYIESEQPWQSALVSEK